MPSQHLSRRQFVRAVPATFVTVTGCLSRTGSSPSPSNSSPQSPTSDKTTAEPNDVDGDPSVASLSVTDFVRYPLAGVHPHVHRREDTQYVLVRMKSTQSAETLREALTLTLDGEPMPLAGRQPVPWANETVDVAFAVSKTVTFDRGQILFDQTPLRSLAGATLDRLNTPPTFELSNPSVSPEEIRPGERVSATVRFDLSNTGEGCGTFGASLSGNFVSGSSTVTATLDEGLQRELTAAVELVGEDDGATVRLDWGTDEWTAEIPAVGMATTTGTATETPAPQ